MFLRAAIDFPLFKSVALLQSGTYATLLATWRPTYHVYFHPIYYNKEPLTPLSLNVQTLTGPMLGPSAQRLEPGRLLFACRMCCYAPVFVVEGNSPVHLRHAVPREVRRLAAACVHLNATLLLWSKLGGVM